MREPAISVLEAQLAASPADRVFAWLEARAGRPKDSPSDTDPQVEKSLLDRKDPLINLGLAQYGIEDDTVKMLFNSLIRHIARRFASRCFPIKSS